MTTVRFHEAPEGFFLIGLLNAHSTRMISMRAKTGDPNSFELNYIER